MRVEKKECYSYISDDGRTFTSESECKEHEHYLSLPKVYLLIHRSDGFRASDVLVKIISSKEKAYEEAGRMNGSSNYFSIEERVVE